MRSTVLGATIIALAILVAKAGEIYFGSFQTCIRSVQEAGPVSSRKKAELVCATKSR